MRHEPEVEPGAEAGSRIDRRRLLRGLGAAGALGGAAMFSRSAHAGVRLWTSPAGCARDGRDEPPRTLVLVQLSGGNDGLNTLVPFADEVYRKCRPTLALPEGHELALDERLGLHPELSGLKALFDERHLAVLPGVGYPNPNRSHFKSFEIWHTAHLEGRASGEGWVGRLAAELFGAHPHPNHVVHVGATLPYSLESSEHPAACFSTPAGYRWAANEAELESMTEGMGAEARGGVDEAGAPGAPEANRLDWLRSMMKDARDSSAEVRAAVARHRPRAKYPVNDRFAESLYAAAGLVQARIGTRVVSVELSGFDTHNDEEGRHRNLLRTLDRGLTAFLDDLRGTEAGDRTVVAVFSEFGRRLTENGSRGTDHGTAGTLFVAGTPVRGGIHGAHPSLEDLDERGDMKFGTDFRSVYATLIEDWLGVSSEAVLGAEFARLPLIERAG